MEFYTLVVELSLTYVLYLTNYLNMDVALEKHQVHGELS